MADIRIHRSEPDRYLRLPNDTARDAALSWAARGYLAELLSQRPTDAPETVEAAIARAVAERGPGAESARQVRAVHAELARAGYMHHVMRRGQRGRVVIESHLYDVPTWPCPDEGTCRTCRPRPGRWRRQGGGQP